MNKTRVFLCMIFLCILSVGCLYPNESNPADVTQTANGGFNNPSTASVFRTVEPYPTTITILPKYTQIPTVPYTRTTTTTYSPTQTSQQVHSWQPDSILVKLRDSGPYLIQPPPNLVIFANGLVVISDISDETGYIPLAVELSRQELCSVLNTIDRFGFFEYEDVYVDPILEGPSQSIEVNAWKTKYLAHISLGCWIDIADPSQCCFGIPCKTPEILPPLLNTYKFLSDYRPKGLQLFPIDEIIVVVRGEESENFQAYEEWPLFTKWPMPELPLKELYVKSTSYGDTPLVLKGDEVKIWQLYMPSGIYRDGDFIARVDSRPLWPYEIPSRFSIFATTIPMQLLNLTCTLDDGWLNTNGE